MLDHEPIKLTRFNGVFNRGEDEVCPPDHFLDAQNLRFTNRGVQTREGSVISQVIAKNIKRVRIYRRINEASRYLILDSTGKLWDSTNIGVGTEILSIAAMTDFSAVSLFGRAYITPHDGVAGLAGEKVYVYNGTGVARAAAGAGPAATPALAAANSATNGKVETGIHLFAFIYETDSGYRTKPGGYVQFTPVGGKKLDVSVIGTGPSTTAHRHLLATKRLLSFNGDFVNQAWFYIPEGKVAGNVATTLTVDFYDADLVESADCLFDALDPIPAGVGIGTYGSRMIVWGENANQSTVRASDRAYPENFEAVDGFVNVNPGDAGAGIKRCWPQKQVLYIAKSQRTYAVSDNGDVAGTWEPVEIDMSVGTEPHGVGQTRDYGEQFQDLTIIASHDGLRVFTGSYSPDVLTWKIQDIWDRINKVAFNKVEIVIDPIAKLIYCSLPLDAATEPTVVWVGDYNDGLDPIKVKWNPWVFPKAPTSIFCDVDYATKTSKFKFGSSAQDLVALDLTSTNDFATAIDSYVEFAMVPHDDMGWQEGEYQFAGVNLMVRGAGNLLVTGKGLDGVQTFTGPTTTLGLTPGVEKWVPFNFTNFKCALKLRVTSLNEKFRLTKATLYAKWTSAGRPQ